MYRSVQKYLLHTQNPSHNNNFPAFRMFFETYWQLRSLIFTSGPFWSGTAYFTEEPHSLNLNFLQLSALIMPRTKCHQYLNSLASFFDLLSAKVLGMRYFMQQTMSCYREIWRSSIRHVMAHFVTGLCECVNPLSARVIIGTKKMYIVFKLSAFFKF